MAIKKYTGRVYVIRSPSTDKVYIGSTIQPLNKRMSIHRSKFNTAIATGDFNTYWCNAFYILENYDCYIELISEHEDISKDELKRLEGEQIRANKHICINKNIAGNTQAESFSLWLSKNRDYNKDKCRKFHELNPEYNKQWNEKNPEYKKQYNKQWREKNKNKK